MATRGVTPSNTWRGGLNGFVAALDPSVVDELDQRPDVVAVEPDDRMTAASTQVDPPWGLDRIDQRSLPLDAGFTSAATGAGVVAYVIDSGLRLTHAEFTGRVLRAAYWDFGDGTGAWDCHGHGTHVAGTLGGTTYGVAKQVGIIPVKVLDCDGNGTSSSVVAGVNWVINDHAAGVPAVANISIGGEPSPAVDAAVQALINDGVTVVVAAGNSAASSCGVSPARVPAAITVAASEMDDDDADYSNFGACNDIFAPGSEILSADVESDTDAAVRSGTSMASPHVAGAAALLLASQPAATPAAVWGALDSASTKGALSECCGDPDKLLYVDPTARPRRRHHPHRRRSWPCRRTGCSTPVSAPACGRQGRKPRWSSSGSAGCRVMPPRWHSMSPSPSRTRPGYVTAYPCGVQPPDASNLNFMAGQTIPNAVIAQVGAGGAVCLYTSTATHLVVDVNGWFPPGAGFGPLSPDRALDTRLGAGMPVRRIVTTLHVAGVHGVSPTAAAVALNVTVTETQAPGFVTVYPCGVQPPDASNLNYAAGQSIPNAVIAKIGAGATSACTRRRRPISWSTSTDGSRAAPGSARCRRSGCSTRG